MSNSRFIHKPVSKWFVLDWQFILATGRFPVFKPAAAVITALPFVTDVARVVPITTTGFWLFWTASVLSLVTFGLTHVFCPDFVRKYEDYAAFEKMGHTHRWMLWLLQLNEGNFISKDYVIRETVEKGLTRPVTALFKKRSAMPNAINFGAIPSNSSVVIGKPANVSRDLYVPLWIDGSQYLLTFLEDDPKLDLKTKELFWIIYSDLTKSGPVIRRIIWFLYATIFLLTVVGIGLHVASPFWSSPPSPVHPIFHLFRSVCGALS